MIDITQIKILITDQKRTEEETGALLLAKAAKKLRIRPERVGSLSVVRHAVDARKKGELCDVYTVRVSLKNGDPQMEEQVRKRADSRDVTIHRPPAFSVNRAPLFLQGSPRPVIVGSGPAGLFCSLALAKAGFRPVLLERGKAVDERRRDVGRFWETGAFLPDSNVQFGEGGAGTFSDGKLYTSLKDREGLLSRVLSVFAGHGAPQDILYEADPHIGTDVLCHVVKSIRETIVEYGGEVRFETRMTGLWCEELPDGRRQVRGVTCGDERLEASAVVLAIGHSARDTFEMLSEAGVFMEEKPFAVGLRIAHPQKLVNEAMYGTSYPGHLGAAAYKLQTRTGSGRSVYSFCMCPGGYIINASGEAQALCVNGMSERARNGRFANSALVCAVSKEDYGSYRRTDDDVLAGMRFQRELERKAFRTAQGEIPVEPLERFLQAKSVVRTEDLPGTASCEPEDGIRGRFRFANVHDLLPEPLYQDLCEGIAQFQGKLDGFASSAAFLAGTETRTSSPVRIVREKTLEARGIERLYPCGEGAGYAGGIMSAAADGLRVAQALAARLADASDSVIDAP